MEMTFPSENYLHGDLSGETKGSGNLGLVRWCVLLCICPKCLINWINYQTGGHTIQYLVHYFSFLCIMNMEIIYSNSSSLLFHGLQGECVQSSSLGSGHGESSCWNLVPGRKVFLPLPLWLPQDPNPGLAKPTGGMEGLILYSCLCTVGCLIPSVII